MVTIGVLEISIAILLGVVCRIWEGVGEMFTSVGSLKDWPGPSKVAVGQIWKSTDGGNNWTHAADLGKTRVFDITKHGSNYYAIFRSAWNDYQGSQLATSTDGTNWTTVTRAGRLKDDFRIRSFGKYVLFLSYSRGQLIAIDSNGSVNDFKLPFLVPDSWYNVYNSVVTVGNEIYALSDSGKVYKSNNLNTWREYIDLEEPLISISYWPAQNSLVVSGTGTNLNLWKISHTSSQETPLPTPTPTPTSGPKKDNRGKGRKN
jgi:hypothetical protein